MYRALRPLTCSMRTLLRPSLDRTRLLFLRDPPPLDMPPPSKGFKTSVCVCEWQTLCGEELREEGGVADVIWEIEKKWNKMFLLVICLKQSTHSHPGVQNILCFEIYRICTILVRGLEV